MRWGERLEYTAEAGPGGFVYVPPYVPHQEINALDDEPAGVRADAQPGRRPVVVNLELDEVSEPRARPVDRPGAPAAAERGEGAATGLPLLSMKQ